MKTFEPNKEMKEGDYVYVSDESEEDALEEKDKRILLRKCKDGFVTVESFCENKYLQGKVFETDIFYHAVPIPKEETKKTITLEVTEEQEREINNILKK